jgi:NAD(P)-dependent dehydrogenase (short-subunit alcohol dehydrogenase family)
MSETNETNRENVALVTGGSRGIGRAIVEELLEDGWRVYLCSRREESVERALGELSGSWGDRVRGRAVDVRSQEQVDAFVAWVEEDAGGIDCLVNNAGLGRFAAVDEISGDDWREVIETNLSGAFYCIRAAAPGMRRRGGGWILNIASLAGKNPFAGGAVYNASKFGMIGMSEAAMLDLRPDGIRVAAIMPGSVATEFGSGGGDDWKLAPEDVARCVRDLLAFPQRALPSRVELRPTNPPSARR